MDGVGLRPPCGDAGEAPWLVPAGNNEATAELYKAAAPPLAEGASVGRSPYVDLPYAMEWLKSMRGGAGGTFMAEADVGRGGFGRVCMRTGWGDRRACCC